MGSYSKSIEMISLQQLRQSFHAHESPSLTKICELGFVASSSHCNVKGLFPSTAITLKLFPQRVSPQFDLAKFGKTAKDIPV